MSIDESSRALGRKIAQLRQRRGLSQREFARLVDRSETWLSQVERGARRLDRMSVLERLAEALEVPLSELAPESPVVAAANSEPEPVTELRLALSSSHALAAVLSESTPPDSVDLAEQVAAAWVHAHASQYEQVGDLLVRLLPELEFAARATDGEAQRAVFAALARAYHACAAVLSTVGEAGGAWVAADRAISAAERADDPLLMAEGAFRLTLVFQAARRFDQARRTASTAADALLPLRSEGKPEALSVWGALHLQLAVVAARENRADDAEDHLDQARSAARDLGGDRNDYQTEFGPTNVALHAVAVAVELGDAGRALRIADEVDAGGMSPERQGRLLLDIARAHAQRRNVAAVVAALDQAAAVTPEQVRAHPVVRTILRDLLRTDQGSHPDLRRLADQIGVRA